jgi:hypothetical protein
MSDDGRPQSSGTANDDAAEEPGMTVVSNGVLQNVHPPMACAGRHCWVHNPSDHHMVQWPINWRDDKGTAERLCDHGLGHPDPDDVAFNALFGRDVRMHGCDGCCR